MRPFAHYAFDRIAAAALAAFVPTGAAAGGPCPANWAAAEAGAESMESLSFHDDGEASREWELRAEGLTVLGRRVAHIFLNDNIGGGTISYVFDAPADDIRAFVFEAYGQVAACEGRTCTFASDARGDLEEATVASSYRALTGGEDRKIPKPTLICGYRP